MGLSCVCSTQGAWLRLGYHFIKAHHYYVFCGFCINEINLHVGKTVWCLIRELYFAPFNLFRYPISTKSYCFERYKTRLNPKRTFSVSTLDS